MYSLRSRNQELNTYINSFIDIHYQPVKMLGWRIPIIFLFGTVCILRDYQYYRWHLEQWFSWSPIFIVAIGLLSINFQSMYLGSMSYQYRHHDTAFVIAREFSKLEYEPLINGLERKLVSRHQACRGFYAIFFLMMVGMAALIGNSRFILELIGSVSGQYVVFSIYIFLILALTLAAFRASISILFCSRQAELIELSLFWIKSASTLKYIE